MNAQGSIYCTPVRSDICLHLVNFRQKQVCMHDPFSIIFVAGVDPGKVEVCHVGIDLHAYQRNTTERLAYRQRNGIGADEV